MSDYYREETQGNINSDEENSGDHIAELETDDFVWEDFWKRSADLRISVWTERVVLIQWNQAAKRLAL